MSAPHTWLVLLLLSSILEALAIATASTIYPPLTQAVYAVTTAISESLIWMKATFLLADLILIGVLIRLLTATGMGTARALIYASSPLVIVEVSGNTPNDVLAPACLMATHSGILHDRSTLSMCFLTLSGLAKLIGFALVALFARSVRAGAWLAVPVTALLVAWPYLGAGWRVSVVFSPSASTGGPMTACSIFLRPGPFRRASVEHPSTWTGCGKVWFGGGRVLTTSDTSES